MLLAVLDFARIASALVVVVGVTSHLGSGAALSPRRCRIASVGAHNRTEMLRLRGVLLTILRLLGLRAGLLSILAVYKRRFTPGDSPVDSSGWAMHTPHWRLTSECNTRMAVLAPTQPSYLRMAELAAVQPHPPV